MKAIRVHKFGGPEVLQLEDVPDPKPGPSEVVVRIRAAGVNPVDTYIRSGTYARKPPLPYVPGSDGAGEIESVGAEIANIAAGDRVYIAGYGNKPSGGGTDRGLTLVREQGADVVVNHHTASHLDEILRATGGRGVDICVEMAAHINLDKDLSLLAPRGRVVVVGNRGRVEIDARQAMGRDAAILGMTLFNATDADVASIHAALGAGLANGTLTPVIGREFPLAEAARAHEAATESGALGKIVLLV